MTDDLKQQGIHQADTVKNRPSMASFQDLNRQVVNPDGNDLGKIEDLVLDLRNKRIAFGILSFGGILGLGEKHYAIPWEMLDYNDRENKFILDIDQDKLSNAEHFDRDRPPAWNNEAWLANLYGYWGYRPYW